MNLERRLRPAKVRIQSLFAKPIKTIYRDGYFLIRTHPIFGRFLVFAYGSSPRCENTWFIFRSNVGLILCRTFLWSRSTFLCSFITQPLTTYKHHFLSCCITSFRISSVSYLALGRFKCQRSRFINRINKIWMK